LYLPLLAPKIMYLFSLIDLLRTMKSMSTIPEEAHLYVSTSYPNVNYPNDHSNSLHA
jgi:hypothetical protein